MSVQLYLYDNAEEPKLLHSFESLADAKASVARRVQILVQYFRANNSSPEVHLETFAHGGELTFLTGFDHEGMPYAYGFSITQLVLT